MIPVFCAVVGNAFLNMQNLNLYAEADSPNAFFWQASGIVVSVTIFFAIPIGYLGYLAFG